MRAVGGEPDDETAEERRRRAAAEFRDRIARGDFRGLFDPCLGRIIEQAAQERNLGQEIGALRVALARLLQEEDDPAKLALGVARLVSAAAQAARTQRALSGDLADGFTEALTQVLMELG